VRLEYREWRSISAGSTPPPSITPAATTKQKYDEDHDQDQLHGFLLIGNPLAVMTNELPRVQGPSQADPGGRDRGSWIRA
jgi:hypothetical protein